MGDDLVKRVLWDFQRRIENGHAVRRAHASKDVNTLCQTERQDKPIIYRGVIVEGERDKMLAFQKDKKLCDVTITAENVTIAAHRIILCTLSPYFEAMFTNGMIETHSKTINLFVKAEVLRVIVDYAYTRKIRITWENVEDIIEISDYLNIVSLLDLCTEFLLSEICPANVLGIWMTTHTYYLEKLRSNCFRFILYNFPEIVRVSNEWCSLPVVQVSQILCQDELNCSAEKTVFDAIVKWVNENKDTKINLFDILKHCRLALFSEVYIINNVNPFVRDSEECHTLITESLSQLLSLQDKNNRGQLNPFPHPTVLEVRRTLGRFRTPSDLLIAYGGWSGQAPTNAIEVYDTRANTWSHVFWPPDQRPRAYHGIAVIDNRVYVIGGFDGNGEYFNTVKTYSLDQHAWLDSAPMHYRRCYVSVAVINKEIYALGGFNGRSRHDSAEHFDPSTNQWSLIANMSMVRSDSCAVEMDGKIYMVGGFNGSECLMSCECYDPELNMWSMIGDMGSRRSGVSACNYHNTLYSIGGFDGAARLKTGERYDVDSNTWTPIADMNIPRSNFGVAVIDDFIYVCGGFNGVTTISDAEKYSDVTNTWVTVEPMEINRSALKLAVVWNVKEPKQYFPTRQRFPICSKIITDPRPRFNLSDSIALNLNRRRF